MVAENSGHHRPLAFVGARGEPVVADDVGGAGWQAARRTVVPAPTATRFLVVDTGLSFRSAGAHAGPAA